MLRTLTLIAIAGLATAASAQHVHILHQADTKWGPAPDTLPPGAEFALIAGDPVKPGPFAFRLKVPAGYIVMPHTHPAAENITIISGQIYHGMGRALDKAAGELVSQGDFVYLPARMPHSVWTTDTPAVIQVNGTGPFTIAYIRAEDDPRNKRR